MTSKQNFHHSRVKVKFQSLKNEATVLCRSKLEADYALVLEFRDDVLAYQVRPFGVRYKAEGKYRVFKPHFLIQTELLQTAVWLDSAKLAAVKEKFNVRLLKNVCFKYGIQLEIVSSDEIRQQPRLNNLKLLWRFSRVKIEPYQILQCANLFKSRQTIIFNDLLAYLKLKNLSLGVAFALLFQKIIDFDINNVALNEETLIHLGENYLN